jgi:hypothetical protein
VVVPVLVELGPGEVWRGTLVPLVVTHDDPYASPNKEIGILPTSAPKLEKKSGKFSYESWNRSVTKSYSYMVKVSSSMTVICIAKKEAVPHICMTYSQELL